MDRYDIIALLQREIQKTACDAKAEAALAMAMEKGLGFEDFMISCDSLFFREYNKDVVFTEIKEDARKLPVLQLHASRGGIYDYLPEGLFYQHASSQSKSDTAADMALDYRLNKQKEQEIRRFFFPFENDFFWQRLELEAEETRLLEGLQSGILNEYFMRFWGIPATIPRQCIVPLILLLPYACRIAGDLPLTAQSLELLLNEKVQVRQIIAPAVHTRSGFNHTLGGRQLGVDLVCGDAFVEDSPELECIIGPLQHAQVSDYLEGGEYFTFLQIFYQFFVPAGAGITTQIMVPAEKMHMQLKQDNEPVVGYSTVL